MKIINITIPDDKIIDISSLDKVETIYISKVHNITYIAGLNNVYVLDNRPNFLF